MGQRGSLLVAAFVSVVPFAAASPARADDPPLTEREKRFERRIEELEKTVDDMNRRLTESATNRSGDELEQRVSELEKLTKKDADGLFGYWKNGLHMDSASGAFKLKIGGRIQNDWSWFSGSSDFEEVTEKQVEAGEEFRRARLYVGGTMYGNVDFMAEYDFAGGTTAFREVWMGTKLGSFARIQVGSMKEPFGFEELTSDLFVTFMERSAGSEAFAPSYNTGAMLWNTCAEDRVTWAAGVFRDAGSNGNDTGNTRSGDYNFTGRVTGRPWIGESPDEFLHVGAAASLRSPSDGTVDYSARPELHLAPVVVDSGSLKSNDVRLGEAETAIVEGPFSATGEYYLADVRGAAGAPNATFHAWAVQASWFLTGESRPYNVQRGVFDRVVPKRNFDGEGGSGAIELAARFDAIDLGDGDVGGTPTARTRMRIWSAGANWYLNPNTKVALDFVHAHVQNIGTLLGLEMRFQVDF